MNLFSLFLLSLVKYSLSDFSLTPFKFEELCLYNTPFTEQLFGLFIDNFC